MTDSSIPDMMAAARRDKWTDQQLAAKAVELAESILKQSNAGMRRKEKKQAEQMERMMNDPAGKAFTLALADRVFRPSSPARGAELFRYLLDGYGIPRYLSAADRFAMKLGDKFSVQFPGVVMPMITSQLRKESSNVILPAEDGKLRSHLRRRRKAGIRMNINQLGEAPGPSSGACGTAMRPTTASSRSWTAWRTRTAIIFPSRFQPFSARFIWWPLKKPCS